MVARQVDNKGRITLGDRFSGTTMLLEESEDGTIILRPAVTVPASEAWLWRNKAAVAKVAQGLAQARRGKFVKGPDLRADAKLARRLEG